MNRFRNRQDCLRLIYFFTVISVGCLFFTACGNHGKTFEKEMVDLSGEINKICPMQIDEHTRLDGTTVSLPSDFHYNYTFVHVIKDSLNRELFVSEMEPHILTNIQTSDELAFLRDNNVTLHYNYRDQYGQLIHRFTFTPAVYNLPR